MNRDRLTTILAAIGAAALLGMAIGGVVGFWMIRRGFSALAQPSSVEVLVARQVRSWSMAATRGLANPVPVTPDVLARAREHWADHCAGCHGNDGRGQTGLGQSLYPRAPDMLAPHTQSLADGELYGIIENGVRLTGMPAWGDGKPANADSWGLVAFIRHLPKQTAEELDQMKAMNPKSAHEHREEREEQEFLEGKGGAR